MQEMQRKLELANSATPFREVQQQDRWDAEPDSTIIRLNLEGLADRKAVETMVRNWLHPLGYKQGTHYDFLPGPPLSQYWTITFKADVGTASRQVKKSMDALNVNGRWEELWVCRPVDAHARIVDNDDCQTTDGQVWIRAYASRDKNAKQKAVEALCKKAKKAAEEIHPNICWNDLKRDGIVCIGWSKCIKVVPSPDKSVVLKWDNVLVEKWSLKKDEIKEAFERLSAESTDNTTWSL